MRSITDRYEELLNEFSIRQKLEEQEFKQRLDEIRFLGKSVPRSPDCVICERAGD